MNYNRLVNYKLKYINFKKDHLKINKTYNFLYIKYITCTKKNKI